jgi:hypothetical protein
MMANKTTIKGVNCYGKMDESQNIVIIGTYADGSGFEEISCNDSRHSTWTKVVNEVLAWGEREGITIDELGSC